MPEAKKKDEQTELTAVNGLASAQSARLSADEAAQMFAKPESYTGNRTLYDSGAAKHHAKLSQFGSGAEVRDPYTGEVLTLTKAEAKLRFGDDWQKHLAESDHIHPLERIHDAHKTDAFLTNEDIRNAANSSDNLEVNSRQYNNAKRSRTNEEFMNDRDYRGRKGLELTEDAEREAVRRGREAQESIYRQLRKASVKNAVSAFHNAGIQGAKNSGLAALTMSGIMNAAAVLKGEKDTKAAIADTLKAGGTGAATGYMMSGGLTVLSQKLSYSTSQLMQTIAKSQLPGQIITAVMIVGGTLKRYASGELSTEDFITELGEKGAGYAAGAYGFAVGQAVIPIPVVGGVVGSMIGYALSGALYGGFMETLNGAKLAHDERIRVERECQEAVRMLQEYRVNIEGMISRYLKENISVFHEAFDMMKSAFDIGDADGFIFGANMITQNFGGNVAFKNMQEFDALMMSDEAFVL